MWPIEAFFARSSLHANPSTPVSSDRQHKRRLSRLIQGCLPLEPDLFKYAYLHWNRAYGYLLRCCGCDNRLMDLCRADNVRLHCGESNQQINARPGSCDLFTFNVFVRTASVNIDRISASLCKKTKTDAIHANIYLPNVEWEMAIAWLRFFPVFASSSEWSKCGASHLHGFHVGNGNERQKVRIDYRCTRKHTRHDDRECIIFDGKVYALSRLQLDAFQEIVNMYCIGWRPFAYNESLVQMQIVCAVR